MARKPKGWKRRALQEVDRRGGLCERCQALKGVSVHHFDGDPTNWQPDNIAVLCPPCRKWAGANLLPGQITLWPEPWLNQWGRNWPGVGE